MLLIASQIAFRGPMTLTPAQALLVLHLAFVPMIPSAAIAQQAGQDSPTHQATTAAPNSGEVKREAAGDSPADAGPMATDLAKGLSHKNVQAAMRKVADWQLRTGEARFNQQWTFAPLYDGLIAASATTGDPRYRDAVERAAERFRWGFVESRFPHADDQAIGLAYLDLYKQHPSPEKIEATRALMDRLVARPDDPSKNLWWWCDALFMAPPVLARLSQITGDPKYVQFMEREWQLTSNDLYDPKEKLFSRDDRFLIRTEKNGQKLFWSRGNGWVLASLAELLQILPANDPMRTKFVAQFQSMAGRILDLQQSDGMWRTGLLDQEAYESPEVSGTGFFTYAMAWGVNAGLLDRDRYTPKLVKAWNGMLDHVYADGRLGAIQPIDAAPGAVKPSSSYVYGVGAFLLAGSELDQMAGNLGEIRKASNKKHQR
jgi:unsaturated rhamnogalacturonyl hydrolase